MFVKGNDIKTNLFWRSEIKSLIMGGNPDIETWTVEAGFLKWRISVPCPSQFDLGALYVGH